MNDPTLGPEEIFLRGVWQMIPDTDDTSWVRRFAEEPGSNEPLGDTGPIVRAMLDAGITEQQIARFARLVGYETAFQLLYHLEDPSASYEDFTEEPSSTALAWELFLVDDNREPYDTLSGLHSMILMKDPTGREMRPPSDDGPPRGRRHRPRTSRMPTEPALELHLFSPVDLLALVESEERFGESFGTPATAGLRAFVVSDEVAPAWLESLRSATEPDVWRFGFAIREVESGTIIGSIGFKGPPGNERSVELAYGVVPSFRGRGHATEAAVAATRFALANDRVDMVVAHTLAVPNASTRVLGRCGFDQVGEFEDPDDGPVWRWECRSAPADRGTPVRLDR